LAGLSKILARSNSASAVNQKRFDRSLWTTSVVDEEFFDLIRPWIQSGDVSKFDIAVDLLASAPGQLVFDHQPRILETLEAAQKLGEETLKRTIAQLISNVQPSFFFGPVNEQLPAMIGLRNTASAALADPTLHPLLRRLLQALKDSASIDLMPFRDDEEWEF